MKHHFIVLIAFIITLLANHSSGGGIRTEAVLLAEEFRDNKIPIEWEVSRMKGKSDWQVKAQELQCIHTRGGGSILLGKDGWKVGAIEIMFKPLAYAESKDQFIYLDYSGAVIRYRPKTGVLQWMDRKLYKEDKKAGQMMYKMERNQQDWQTLKVEFINNAPKIYLNGKYVFTGKALDCKKSRIKIGCWMMSVAIKKIKVSAVMDDHDRGYNFIGNSSFENATNPDVPDFWFEMDHAFGIKPCWVSEKGWQELHDKWHIDKTMAYDGKQCFSLKKPCVLISSPAPIAKGNALVASFYLKSKQTGANVRIGIGQAKHHARGYSHKLKEKTVQLSKGWKRYSVLLPNSPGGKINVFIEPLDESRIWVDAVQLEKGTCATPYTVSAIDEQFQKPFFSDASEQVYYGNIPEYIVKNAKPEKLDGSLDEKNWQQVAASEMKEYMGADPLEKTSVKFMRDGENLYIGVDCKDSDVGNLVVEKSKKTDDDKSVFGKDAIEIFLDPEGDGQLFYQLAFSSDGRRFDMVKIDQDGAKTAWNGNWQFYTKKNRDGWSAEVVIPFEMMQISPDHKSMIRCNVCRDYPRGVQGLYAWSPVKFGFHDPKEFGKLLLDDNGDEISFDIVENKLTCNDPVKNGYEWRMKIVGKSREMVDVTVCFTLNRESGKDEVIKKKISIGQGKAFDIFMPVLGVNETELKGCIAIIDEAKNISYKKERVALKVVKPLDAFFEYTYYTAEKSARLIVETAIPGIDDVYVTIRGKEGGLMVGDKLVVKNKGCIRYIDVPLETLSCEQSPFKVKVDALDVNGRICASVNADLSILPGAVTEVKINRVNRGIYVNGRPFIPYITLHSLPGKSHDYAEHIAFLKKGGMNALSPISHWYGENANRQFLEEAEKQNMPVIMFSMMDPRRRYDKQKRLELFKQSPAVIGVCVADEVTSEPEWSFDMVRKAKIVNPHILNFASHNMASLKLSESHPSGTSGDLYSIDRYPVMAKRTNYRATREMYTLETAMEQLAEAAEKKRLPMNAWVQGGFSFIREPSTQEVEWMIYLPLVMGVRGFMYFANIPRSKVLWEKMGDIGKEIEGLTPILFSQEAVPDIKAGDSETKGAIRFITRQYNGKVYIIAVNRLMRDVKAVFDLTGLKQEANDDITVMFEGRELEIDKECFKDTFAPLARHVYCFDEAPHS